MLDCKMTSLSPATPMSILSECYGIWDHENLNSSIVTKLESTDIMDFIEPSLTIPTTLDCSGVITLDNQSPHLTSRGEYSFHTSQQYLTPLPPLGGGDPYSPSDCQMLDTFHCIGSMDSPFQKLSDTSSFSSENYDNFIPELTHHHHHSPHHQHPSSSSHLGQSQSLGSSGLHLPLQTTSSSSYLFQDSSGTTGISNHHQEYNIWEGLTCDPGNEYSFLRKGDSPTTSESIMSYTDIDSEIESKSSRESLSTFTEISRNGSPPKRRVGRPPKKDKKLKRVAEKKTGRLWEFIRDLLKNPDYCPSLVRWENPEEGHFRFVNSEKVAQLWGQIKGNPRMTYEKLSRAMRYYYKSHVFEPVLGRRLVYKFGYNATNWRPINPNFVQKLY